MVKDKRTYKSKHIRQLNRIKNFTLAVALGTMMTGCGQKTPEKEDVVKDIAYYFERGEVVDRRDMFGHIVPQKVVEIIIYKKANMKEERFRQLLWGTPAQDLPNAYQNEKTHAELLYPTEYSEPVWIEVFVNSYGVTVLKDQPCFAVDENKRVVYIGDSSTYDSNMLAFKTEMETRKKNRSQREDRENQMYQERQQRWDDKQKRQVHQTRVQTTSERDSVVSVMNSDTIKVAQSVPDSISIVKDTLGRE